MIIHDVLQRSPEWFALRAGKVTGSRAGDMMALLKKGGDSAARIRLRDTLVAERLTGQHEESTYVSQDMQRGIDREAEALSAFEARTGLVVSSCGFLQHETLAAGVSLDGQADAYAALLEIKCPKAVTHAGYLREGLPEEYYWQCVHALFIVPTAEVCHFVSFHPAFHEELRLSHRELHREDVDLGAYESALTAFLATVDEATRTIGWPVNERVRGGRA